MSTNLARTPGTSEADCAPTSGLRRMEHTVHLESNQVANIDQAPIGGASSADVTSWTSLALDANANPYCGTLVALIEQASPVAGTVQLRIKGFDQFHQEISTVTPVVTLAAKANNFIYLPHTLAWVTSVEFLSTGLDIAGDTLSLGTRWDWTRTIDGSNEHLFGRNLGFAIFSRIGRRPEGYGSQRRFEQSGPAAITLFEQTSVAGVAQPNLLSQGGRAFAGHAMATLLIGATPANGETVTIGSTVYTFNTVLGGANSVLIGGSSAVAAANLVAAISAAPNSGEGTAYGTGTEPNPDVLPVLTNTSVTVVARSRGAIGNTIAVAETLAAGGSVWAGGVTTLARGFDQPVEVQSIEVYNKTDMAAAGMAYLDPTDILIGYTEDGWEGPVEKVHMIKQSDVASWGVADDVFVTVQSNSLEYANG